MIGQNFINNLTDDEKSMLLGIVNLNKPFNIEIDLNLIKYYQFHILKEKIILAKYKIKNEFLPVFSGLCQKFDVK